jgi:hypothetical protein
LTHIHHWADRTGESTGYVPDQAHDADSYYEIKLTVTDSSGQQGTDTVVIHPRTVRFTVASSPPGASLLYGGSNATSATAHTSAVGFKTTVDAAASFAKAGRTYVFDGWSDGGARTHNITVPAADTTLTARYRDLVPPVFTPPGDDGPDDSGPLIDFQRFDSRRGVVRGAATSGTGLESLSVAVGKRSPKGRGCRWWQVSKRRLSRGTRPCGRPVWIHARLRKQGDGGWTWRASLGRRRIPAGLYRVVFRAADAGGKTTRQLANGQELARVRVHRRRRR